jgi:predicted nucleic acid-binding protein
LKLISLEVGEQMIDQLLSLEFERISPDLSLRQAAWRWAERLGQLKVYDAHYVALAESLAADFWTVDQRLYHALHQLGTGWVHSISLANVL